MLAVTTSTLPLSTVIPIHSSLLIGGLISRILTFFPHINWRSVSHFSLGCCIGVYIGATIYVELPEWLIAIILSVIMFSVWLPDLKVSFNFKKPFLYIGVIHAFFSTLFSFGGFLHATLVHMPFTKLQIVATGSCSLLALATLKIIGYSLAGFDYSPFFSLILWCFVVSFVGTWIGKYFIHAVSEQVFRLALKTVMTLMGINLLYKSGIFF